VAGLVVPALWAVALVLGLAGPAFWLARPRSLDGAWRRIRIMAWPFGPPRRASETHPAYARRLGRALPADTTTVRHRHGNAPPGQRLVRGQATALLQLLAATAGRDAFGNEPLGAAEIAAWQRAWRRLVRVWPLLLWRRLVARTR